MSVRIPRNVLAEEITRPAGFHPVKHPVEQPSLVVFAEALSGEAVGLAGVARSDAIHDAAPRLEVEGSKVRPDRRLIQGLVFHARDKAGGGMGFPLDVTDAARVGSGDLDSKFEAADPGTNSQHIHATSTAGGSGISALRGRQMCRQLGWTLICSVTATCNCMQTSSSLKNRRLI